MLRLAIDILGRIVWGKPGSCRIAASSQLLMESLESRRLSSASVPQFDHVVVVVEENKAYSQIIGSRQAPFINSLVAGGVLFTKSYGVTHPSQPNYLALFSGSTQHVKDDNDHGVFKAPNLAQALRQQHLSFMGYTDGVVRKHNPWLQFSKLPKSVNQSMSHFPTDFTKLPTVSFVVPNQAHDMHDGSIRQGDGWLASRLGRYAQWATTHNSLLIVTFDEDDDSDKNHIATIFSGANIVPGESDVLINHYNVLRTIEEIYDLAPVGRSAVVAPITDVWVVSSAGLPNALIPE